MLVSLSIRRIFADNLQYYMELNGVNRNDICEKLGFKYTTICDWINAKTYPRIDKIELLADFFGITKKDLIEKRGGEKKSGDPVLPILAVYDILNVRGREELLRYARYLSEQADFKSEERRADIEYIRHYFVPAAAGYASPIEGEDYELIPKGGDIPHGADFCIDIAGDSMEPYIKDGECVYVRRDAVLSDYDVGIFFVDGDVLCKQLCVDFEGTLHLLSANPEREDANRTIPKDSASNVVCFGKVLLPKALPRPHYN